MIYGLWFGIVNLCSYCRSKCSEYIRDSFLAFIQEAKHFDEKFGKIDASEFSKLILGWINGITKTITESIVYYQSSHSNLRSEKNGRKVEWCSCTSLRYLKSLKIRTETISYIIPPILLAVFTFSTSDWSRTPFNTLFTALPIFFCQNASVPNEISDFSLLYFRPE